MRLKRYDMYFNHVLPFAGSIGTGDKKADEDKVKSKEDKELYDKGEIDGEDLYKQRTQSMIGVNSVFPINFTCNRKFV